MLLLIPFSLKSSNKLFILQLQTTSDAERKWLFSNCFYNRCSINIYFSKETLPASTWVYRTIIKTMLPFMNIKSKLISSTANYWCPHFNILRIYYILKHNGKNQARTQKFSEGGANFLGGSPPRRNFFLRCAKIVYLYPPPGIFLAEGGPGPPPSKRAWKKTSRLVILKVLRMHW
jgi:hypothetical protein